MDAACQLLAAAACRTATEGKPDGHTRELQLDEQLPVQDNHE